MSKFWMFVALLLFTGLLLNFLPSGGGINFTDLETECRYDRGTVSDMSLNHQRIDFSGHYPVETPETDLSYSYSVSGDEIVLDVKSSDTEPLIDFYNDCRAVAIYDAQTDRIEKGTYMITVKHDGEKVDRRVIEIG